MSLPISRTATAGVCALLLGALLSSGPAWAQEGLASIQGVQVSASSADVTVIRVAIAPGAGMPNFSAFQASGPDRVVLDVARADVAQGVQLAGAAGLVRAVESSGFNDGTDNTRLTFLLTEAASQRAVAEGNSIVLTLTRGAVQDPLAGALGKNEAPVNPLSVLLTSVTGPALTSVDFQQQDKVSRVMIGTQQTEPAISQPEPTLIAVDLPGAQIPAALTRDLDARRFFSAVDDVSARPTRSGTRVEIRLRAPSEYSVARDGNLLYIDVKIPPELLAQRDAGVQAAAVAAPSTPADNGGEGLRNSTGGEVLIGSTGQTIDPQAKYGTGGGTGTGPLAWAEEAPGHAGRRYTGRRMSIDLQEADIHTVFRFIADVADINIVASDGVSGKVTVHLKDVPWDEALAAVLQSKGLAAQRFGDILRVAAIEIVRNEQQAALEAKKAKDDLEPLETYVAPLNYSSAEDIEKQIIGVLSPRGKVTIDGKGNQLIIRDTGPSIVQVRELMRALDKQNRQVSIEARFVEATSNFTRSLGIQWGSELNASATTGYPTGAFFPNTVGVTGGIGGDTRRSENLFYDAGEDALLVDLGASGASSAIDFALGSIPGLINLDARLSALQSEGWGKIVSNPRITALDNEEASVSQGARVPYKTVSNGGTQTQFIEAKLELTVTPHITTSNTVFLEVEIKNNRPDTSILVDGQPSISTKEIKTRVLVPDGDTAVLGGVYATSESWSQQRVPGLGSIPLLGYLFRNSNKTRDQNEMLVFITPRIIPDAKGS